jgi:hypothetical protein
MLSVTPNAIASLLPRKDLDFLVNNEYRRACVDVSVSKIVAAVAEGSLSLFRRTTLRKR